MKATDARNRTIENAQRLKQQRLDEERKEQERKEAVINSSVLGHLVEIDKEIDKAVAMGIFRTTYRMDDTPTNVEALTRIAKRLREDGYEVVVEKGRVITGIVGDGAEYVWEMFIGWERER